MQAVLDATSAVADHPAAEVTILEVASPAEIADGVAGRRVSRIASVGARHGRGIELEDEDGNPLPTTAAELVAALRHAGGSVPLVVLSAVCGSAPRERSRWPWPWCATARTGCIAMHGSVTERYATALAAASTPS